MRRYQLDAAASVFPIRLLALRARIGKFSSAARLNLHRRLKLHLACCKGIST
jgi:hypothetical protein